MPETKSEILQGTLDLMVLKMLDAMGPLHGYGIAQRIQDASEDVLHVEEGSLYPALQRMLMKGWVTAEWSQTELNRKARFYKLTPPGKKQLAVEVEEFRRVTRAIESILQPGE